MIPPDSNTMALASPKRRRSNHVKSILYESIGHLSEHRVMRDCRQSRPATEAMPSRMTHVA